MTKFFRSGVLKTKNSTNFLIEISEEFSACGLSEPLWKGVERLKATRARNREVREVWALGGPRVQPPRVVTKGQIS